MEFLARRGGNNFHTGIQHIFLFGEHQIRMTATKKVRKHFLKIGAHLFKSFGEHFARLFVDTGNHFFQLGFGVHQIFVLCIEEIEALFDLLIFVNRHQVHWPHAVDFVLHFLDFGPDAFPVGGDVGLAASFISHDGLSGGLAVGGDVNSRYVPLQFT